ncbi:hypothetical protein ACF0H5_019704 [Mactra antiquata]
MELLASDVVKSSSDGFEYLLRSRSGDELSLTQITEPYEVPDEWPSGSYTLLMSKYGCPRGRWKRGYISFNWKSPQILLSHGHKFHCNNYNITTFEYSTQCRKLISDKTLPTSSSKLFGPFSKYKMTLNFCQRQMDANGADNRNTWPKVSFRIFDSNGTCPKGFKTEENTLTLPNITTWTYNGYLPTFSLTSNENGHNILTIKECISEDVAEVNTTYYLNTNGSAFILLKHGDEPCPALDSYDVWTELISIFEELSTSSTVTRLLQFCYFQPTSWLDYDSNKEDDKGNTLRTYKILYGGTENFRRMSGGIGDGQTHTMFCSKQALCWFLIDLGRSLLIRYVSIINVSPEGVVFNSTVQAGNDKWTLLSYGGIEIASNSDTGGLETIGRFIIVLIQSASVMDQHFEVQVHAEYTNTICMSDLGMSDGTIETTQISTSDIIQKNLDSVRPYSRGWCSTANDPYPFIQVDLLEDTLLDGITIYNWYETYVSINNGSYTKTFQPTGTRTFRVVYTTEGDAYANMTFHVELFRPLDEPQTFVFHKQVKTRYVMINLEDSFKYGQQYCIKFELHGCRKNDMLSIPNLMYQLDEYTVAYAGAVKTITTPSHVTNVGYPLPYRDGTSYTWILDFRNVGYIKIVFVDIFLQEYEDKTFTNFWYDCKDTFTIKNIEDKYWTVPTSVKHENIIIETQQLYLIMEFTSCIPYTPRKDEGTRFSLYVDKMDLPACASLSNDIKYDLEITEQCQLSPMILSTLTLKNIPTNDLQESWTITLPKFSIRLRFTHFHILCQSGRYLEVSDQFSPPVEYTNCDPPMSELLSEAESITISYKMRHQTLLDTSSLMEEGFRATYTRVEASHQGLLDTVGHDYIGLQNLVDTRGLSGVYKNGTSVVVYKACSSTFMKCYTIFTGTPLSWQLAGDECWARGKNLVSIRSKEELYAVKYMMRTFLDVKIDDGSLPRIFEYDTPDPYYYLHIGISRITTSDGNQQFVWIDGSPLLFSAWGKGQPKTDGNCVRMSFHQVTKEHTWEVEDCHITVSQYFICEEAVEELPLPSLSSTDPKTYVGTMNVTKSERECQRWDSQTPHEHPVTLEYLPDVSVSAAENYCRDPYEDGYLWCFTTDPDQRWDICPVAKLEEWLPGQYKGKLSVTVSGRTCQRWDSDLPHWHDRDLDSFFPDETVADASNYCRDPQDETGALWCYTEDPDLRWDYCKLRDIVSDRCYETHSRYQGRVNVTVSGKICQRWDTDIPHYVYYTYIDATFPDGSISDAQNYCRDPENQGYIWCYTIDPLVRWEYCFDDRTSQHEENDDDININQCKDRSLISQNKICNGLADCIDSSDELLCSYQVQVLLETEAISERRHVPTFTQFVCGSQEIISILAVCDGIADCTDGSDEINCDKDRVPYVLTTHTFSIGGRCTKDEFECDDGKCLHASLVCDFVPHCRDHSDEKCVYEECKYGEFRCKNGQCIALDSTCNAYEDCFDGSDETNCDSCTNDAFHCDLTKCIPKRLVCDTIPDCRDSSDEQSCTEKQFLTCEHRWLNGLKKTGKYTLKGGANVECNYDSVQTEQTIYTLFHAVEYRISDTVYEIRLNTDENELQKFLNNDDYDCRQTFRQTCTFPVRTALHIEDPDTDNQRCRCIALSVKPYIQDSAFVHECNDPSIGMNVALINFSYNVGTNGPYLNRTGSFTDDIGVKIGPIICKNENFWKSKAHEYTGKVNTTINGTVCQRWDLQYPWSHKFSSSKYFPDDSMDEVANYCRDPSESGFIWCYLMDAEIKWQKCEMEADLVNVTSTSQTCDEPGLTYTNDVRCIYKTDSAGYILGCRSGFHLQDCAEFVCPPATVKCPGSYCIPLHYVCDGINQCPNGEDETGCGCNNNDLELIILQSEDEFISQDDLIKQFIRQFYYKGRAVRLLKYHMTPFRYDKSSIDLENKKLLPGYNILNIVDSAIDLSDVTNTRHDCFYNIRDDVFMGSIKFSKAKSRVLVFLQNGTNSATVADIIFRNMTKPDFDVYRIIGNASKSVGEGLHDGYRYVTDITIDNFDILSTMGSRLFPSFCDDTSSTLCKNNFKCSSSKLCIAYESVCDGHKNCPFGDDEVFCDFQCPAGCTCVGYYANCDPSVYFDPYQNDRISNERLRILDLSTNRQSGELSTVFINIVLKFPYMIRLNMSNCNIEQILSYNFEHVPNLMVLDLSYNKLSRIPRMAFYGLSKLVYLNLHGNTGLMTYEPFAFSGLESLTYVTIEGSDIHLISHNSFWGLSLDALVLSHNKIGVISDDAFNGLSVEKILFEGNAITQFDSGLFRGISNLQSLSTSAYKYCCVAPDYLDEFSCSPPKDEFSSCDDLMRNSALQTILWLMGILALFGNVLAIIYRIAYDRERLKLGFGIFVTNLAVADLFMGVYLLIIAVADASFRKRYIFMDEYWRNSGWCTLAGVLSTVSSEASVFFLCLITLDRFIVIKFPFSRLRFTPEKAGIAATIAWVLSLTISVVPLIDNDHFQSRFYTKSGVCIALPLTRDRPPGWLYSVIVFIVINFVTFIGIAIGQLSIYMEINNVSSKLKTKRTGKNKASRRKELIIARNLLLVVATDFLCWFPIGCMGMMAMSGKVIPSEVYAWSAVFILPVNSALNPVLYTLTAILSKRQQEKALMKTYSARNQSKSLKKKGGVEKMLVYFLPMKENYHTTLVSIEVLINEQMEVSPDVLLKFTAQMTHCLRLLHKHSMVLDTIDTSNVFVTMDYGKLSGKLHVKHQPKHEVSVGKKREDIYKMGIIIRRLMANTSKQV